MSVLVTGWQVGSVSSVAFFSACPFSFEHAADVVKLSALLYLASSEMIYNCHLIPSTTYCFNWAVPVYWGIASFVHVVKECFCRPVPFNFVHEIQVRRYRNSRCFWRSVHDTLNVTNLSLRTYDLMAGFACVQCILTSMYAYFIQRIHITIIIELVIIFFFATATLSFIFPVTRRTFSSVLTLIVTNLQTLPPPLTSFLFRI